MVCEFCVFRVFRRRLAGERERERESSRFEILKAEDSGGNGEVVFDWG